MYRLASVLYVASCIAAAHAQSSIPIGTQPILSTSTVSALSDALSTSLSTILSTSTIVLYTTTNSRGKVVTSSVGEQLSVFTFTSGVVFSASVAELSTIVETIGSTTLYSTLSSTPSASPPTSASSIPAPIVATAQTPATTPVNYITSTASLSDNPAILATTALAATTTTAISSAPSSPKSSKKKLSGGASAGIAIGAILLLGSIVGALFFIISKRRKEKKWGLDAASHSPDGESESKTNLFSPDASAGYDNMWKKPGIVSEKEIEVVPGTSMKNTTTASPAGHERCDSSTLGVDAPPISPEKSVMPLTDALEGRPVRKTVPNFSTPIQRNASLTALPSVES